MRDPTCRSRRAIASVLADPDAGDSLHAGRCRSRAMSNQNELQAANLALRGGRPPPGRGRPLLRRSRNSPTSPSPPGPAAARSWTPIATSLAAQLDGTPNLQGAVVTNAGGVITIPAIRTDGDGAVLPRRHHRGRPTPSGSRSTGVNGAITRTVEIACQPRGATTRSSTSAWRPAGPSA